MIYFVFISPDGFLTLANDNADHSGLRDLDALLFPRGRTANVFLADAHDPNWCRQLRNKILGLPERHRSFAYKLYERIKEKSLVAWDAKNVVPNTESDWIKLVLSQDLSLVDCVLACQKIDDEERVESLERIRDDEWFEERFPDRQRIPRTLTAQKPLFQKLLLNADWCVIDLPYVRGSQDDEIATINQIIQIVHQQSRKRPVEIDLVAPAGWNLKNVRHQLQTIRSGSGVKLRIFELAELRDRNFVTGTFTEISQGKRLRVPKWGVFMLHVAFGRDQSGPGNFWALMTKSQTRLHLDDRIELFRKEKPMLSLPE